MNETEDFCFEHPEDSIPMTMLLKTHPEMALDYLELRFIAAGLSAEMAALHATDEQRERIAKAFQAIEAHVGKNDADAECQADRDFHMAIYAASHNVVMNYVMNSIFGLLHRDVFYDRAHFRALEGVHEFLFRQHKAIHDAIMAKDPEKAREAAEKHVHYIRDSLMESRVAEHRAMLAERRLHRAQLAQDAGSERKFNPARALNFARVTPGNYER